MLIDKNLLTEYKFEYNEEGKKQLDDYCEYKSKAIDEKIIKMLAETADEYSIDTNKTKEENLKTVLNIAAEKVKEEKDFTEFNK